MTKFNNHIYMAYGSNLNKEMMKDRCPNAEPIGSAFFPDYRLCFKGVADMIPAKGFKIAVGLWRLTDACELALDRYEGFPHLYRKNFWKQGDTGNVYMAYLMNKKHFGPPSQAYFDCIADGYHDFKIPITHLNDALQHSYDEEMADPYVSKKWG
jgi:hypothetical protein